MFQVGGAGGYYLFISDSVPGLAGNDVVVSIPNVTAFPGIVLNNDGLLRIQATDNKTIAGTASDETLAGALVMTA